ncbi:hypothetical protein B0G93_10799 [Bacillus sp. V-88]|nr:hypothetical protein B1B00_09735 [Bacillus sp. DSM 27956]PRX76815.1 hypothetical protein B0G93_10799 [Bacillus sp. V-88]SLK22039.1 hypothetical protein SAMN06295884_10799 [Bacillus sp. V-88]
MTIKMMAQKYYKGNLSLLEDPKRIYDFSNTLYWENAILESDPLSEEAVEYWPEFANLFDINCLKNIMLFAEINRYRGRLLTDINAEERNEVDRLIIEHLNQFHIRPIGYEVKRDVIVIAWYMEDVMSTYNLSENLYSLIDPS